MKIEVHVHNHFPDTKEILSAISELKGEIMSAIDTLKTAVDQDIAASTAGFDAIGSAMQELSSDIANLPQAADVEAEAARLSQNAATITDAFNTAAQSIRDALPTEPAPTPEPTPEPAPEG